MAKRVDAELEKDILKLYDAGYTQAGIRDLLEIECGIKVPYHTINDLKPANALRRINYSRTHNNKDGVRKKRALGHNLVIHIMDIFNSKELSAHQIRINLNEKFDVDFTPDFEDRIDKTINDFEKKLGKNSPIVKTKFHRNYQLNKKSPYYVKNSDLESQEK